MALLREKLGRHVSALARLRLLVRAAIAAAMGKIEGRYPSSMKWAQITKRHQIRCSRPKRSDQEFLDRAGRRAGAIGRISEVVPKTKSYFSTVLTHGLTFSLELWGA